MQKDATLDKLNINAADADSLDAIAGLEGHGFEIVRYREERGRFDSVRQLEEVPGMAGVLDDTLRAQLLAD